MFVRDQGKEQAITIGLIDNYAIMRMGLSMIFREHFIGAVVMEAETVDEFAGSSRSEQADVILLGINNASTEESLTKAAAFRAAFPGKKLIVYDEQLEYNLIVGYHKLGIKGYVRKNSGQDEMLRCIENVMQGNFHLCPELTSLLLDYLTRSAPRIITHHNLSGRESQIAGYLCQGMKTSAIAQTLSRKPSTVSTIKHNILKKMNVNNVVELMSAMQKMPMRVHRNR